MGRQRKFPSFLPPWVCLLPSRDLQETHTFRRWNKQRRSRKSERESWYLGRSGAQEAKLLPTRCTAFPPNLQFIVILWFSTSKVLNITHLNLTVSSVSVRAYMWSLNHVPRVKNHALEAPGIHCSKAIPFVLCPSCFRHETDTLVLVSRAWAEE